MDLKLSEDLAAQLRQYAARMGMTEVQAAAFVINKTIHDERVAKLSSTFIDRDRELLDRLGQ